MKISITYFYNIRFFSTNMIPVSTAIFDPKWYHNNLGNNHVYLDKNGVYNGLKVPELSPEKVKVHDCCKDCPQTPPDCSFLKAYREYIYSLDFDKIHKYLSDLARVVKKNKRLRYEPEIILMVHEKPDNPCSERGVLIDWFRDNGVEVTEFEVKR